ncbi:hypothetical protein GCM10010210_52860 [Pseudonocardia hydrocarbonoxydans]|uniref:Uncharacterized protein n=2 Tax=Pseudonocardia TaxID=1847 RepID=A0A4Y3WSQ7_9PSEU|nr:hypothetical protein PHY01_41850 [Pseudonocardia hydrocarbonoxydans]
MLDGVTGQLRVLGQQLAQGGHRRQSITCDAGPSSHDRVREGTMSKRARKRRDRKKGGANHGKRPNT